MRLAGYHQLGDSVGNAINEQGIRIIVVDDSVGIQRVTRSLLETAGYEVEIATDGFEALSRIVEFRPHMILIDVTIPRINGYQVCAVIKQNPMFADIPIILLGTKDRLYDRVRGRVVGANQYLLKPFSRDELLEVIERHVGDKSREIITDKIAS